MILTETQVNKILKYLEENNMTVELILFVNWIRNNPDRIIRETNLNTNNNSMNNPIQSMLTKMIFQQLFPFLN